MVDLMRHQKKQTLVMWEKIFEKVTYENYDFDAVFVFTHASGSNAYVQYNFVFLLNVGLGFFFCNVS